jgi:hypothetical protein
MNHEYLITQLQFGGGESYSNSGVKQKLNFSHPTKELVWVIQPDANVVGGANRWADFTDNGTGPNPYAGNDPLVDARIQLNTHDRITTRKAAYFNLMQPYNHHTRVPATGVYVYSFALEPEKHQPSGSINMSRIEGVNLLMNLSTGTSPVRVYPYAVNYNVLRITSGMGGVFTSCAKKYHSIIVRAPMMGKSLWSRKQMNLKFICLDTDASKENIILIMFSMQHNQIDGKSLRAFTTTLFSKDYKGPQITPGSNSNKVNDWVIRSQVPKFIMIEYGKGSTTRWLWAGEKISILYEGLRYSLALDESQGISVLLLINFFLYFFFHNITTFHEVIIKFIRNK